MTAPEPDPPTKRPADAVVEHAIETFVYAPIGLLFEGGSLLPQLVEKGRNQVTMARMIGKFALEQGRVEATKAAGKLQDQAAGLLDFIGGSVTPPPADRSDRQERPSAPSARNGANRAPGAARQAARSVAGVAEVAPTAPTEPAPDVTELAIPDYDGLSASHVVNRLAGLAADELEAVRAYEAANRGRKTILSKVAQLQSA